MDPSPSRLQLRFVKASYAVVVVVSSLLIYKRYLQYVRNPQDAAASSGMYAGGDLMLEIFICFLFLVPTVALVFVIRKSESAYTAYAKVLLGLSLTAPISVVSLAIPVLNQWYWGGRVYLPIVCDPHRGGRPDFQLVVDSLCACSPTDFLCAAD